MDSKRFKLNQDELASWIRGLVITAGGVLLAAAADQIAKTLGNAQSLNLDAQTVLMLTITSNALNLGRLILKGK